MTYGPEIPDHEPPEYATAGSVRGELQRALCERDAWRERALFAERRMRLARFGEKPQPKRLEAGRTG